MRLSTITRLLAERVETRSRSRSPWPVARTPADRTLWIAVAIAALADLGTTAVGLRLGLVEANPVGVAALEIAGLPGMVVLKGAAVGCGLAVVAAIVRAPDWIVPDYATLLVPTALATVWLLAATWNAASIAAAPAAGGPLARLAGPSFGAAGLGTILVTQYGLATFGVALGREE